MKELIINVPEDAVEFVEELVERIGGTKQVAKNKKRLKKPENKVNPKPMDFFGTWKDIPLDPKTYRDTVWRTIPEL